MVRQNIATGYSVRYRCLYFEGGRFSYGYLLSVGVCCHFDPAECAWEFGTITVMLYVAEQIIDVVFGEYVRVPGPGGVCDGPGVGIQVGVVVVGVEIGPDVDWYLICF